MYRLMALVVVALVVATYPIYGDQLPFGALGHVATPRPRPTYVAPTQGPTPTPEAWRSDPNHPVNLFVARMTASAVTYHVDEKATLTYLGSNDTLGIKWDVKGMDLDRLLTYNTAQGTTQEHAIRIGDALYIKEGT